MSPYQGMILGQPNKIIIMKIVGIVLIISGISRLIFSSYGFNQKEKVVDFGSIQIDKNVEKTIGWPVYAGGIAVVAGLVLIVADSKKAA